MFVTWLVYNLNRSIALEVSHTSLLWRVNFSKIQPQVYFLCRVWTEKIFPESWKIAGYKDNNVMQDKIKLFPAWISCVVSPLFPLVSWLMSKLSTLQVSIYERLFFIYQTLIRWMRYKHHWHKGCVIILTGFFVCSLGLLCVIAR